MEQNNYSSDESKQALETLRTMFRKEESINAMLRNALREEQKAKGKTEEQINEYMSKFESGSSAEADSFDDAYQCVSTSLQKFERAKTQLNEVVNKSKSLVQKLVAKNTYANKAIKVLEQERDKKDAIIDELNFKLNMYSGNTKDASTKLAASQAAAEQYKSELKQMKEECMKKTNLHKAEKKQIIEYYEKKIQSELQKGGEYNRLIDEKSKMLDDIRDVYSAKEMEYKNCIKSLNIKYEDKINEMEEMNNLIKNEKSENEKLKRENKKLYDKIFEFIILTKEMKKQIKNMKHNISSN